MLWPKTDLTTIIDQHTSTTKGLLSNSLMINKIRKNRFHHNKLSQLINYERTIVKISIVKKLPQKTNCNTGDNIPARQFFLY